VAFIDAVIVAVLLTRDFMSRRTGRMHRGGYIEPGAGYLSLVMGLYFVVVAMDVAKRSRTYQISNLAFGCIQKRG
jgi:hypothetical protein